MSRIQNSGKIVTGILIIISAVLFAGCMPSAPQKQEQVFAVNVMPATSGELIDYLEVNGDIEATSNIDVFADKAGEIIGINVSLGQYVLAGQTIAFVDASRPGQSYIPNPVRAPISGTITSLPIRIGATISMASPIAKISRTNDLIITTNVAERFVARMKTGLTAQVWLEAYPDEAFTAKVTEVSPVIDPVTRSLAVKLAFTGKTDKIKTGMFAEVRIITETKQNVIKIPFVAVVRVDDKSFVFVAKEGQPEEKPAEPEKLSDAKADTHIMGIAEKREVKTGLVVDNKVEIKAGLQAGEKVIIQGQKSLDDQSKIRIIEESPGIPEKDEIGGGAR
ncbi:MAG: efflux RND transporter periplasmic adaptor subunit [Spirochaetales bacterium]|nr:efflux RND transporter periplasmic adaptor subunit [Spirochaetales bacterium]